MAFKQAIKNALREWAPSLLMTYAHYRSPKEREISFLPTLVSKGIVAVDVGAHGGMYTRPLARIASHVHAFEPTETFTVLSRSVPSNVTVYRQAVSDRVGEAVMSIPDARDATTLATLEHTANATGRQITVPVTTLDEAFANETIGFVKIDVEGHEVSVVKGAAKLISRCHPVFLIECEERHHPGALDWLVMEFKRENYSCCYLSPDRRLVDIGMFNHEQHQVSGQEPYINNFIFLPAGHPLTPR